MCAKLIRFFIFACCVAMVATLQVAGKASAQTRIAVIGDSLAQDLWFGFRDLYGASGKRKFLKYTKASSGLVKRSFHNWNAQAARIAANNIQIAIVMIGGNDRQGFGGHARFSKGWRAAYRARVDQLNRTLKRRIGRVYWVGLPNVRSGRMSRDYRKLNEIYAASAAANGVRYISIWEWTSANKSLLRADGLHFTSRGTVALARRVGAVMF